MKHISAAAAALALALFIAACADPVPPTAPTPVPATITEMFSGTLIVAGNNTHQFTVQRVGAVKVILTSVDPGATLGIGVGTPSTGVCAVSQEISAVPGASMVVSGTATVTGNFCVSVADIGNLVAPVNYTVTVQHS
jgi:hypothetical protein